jgi:hypothetical protein
MPLGLCQFRPFELRDDYVLSARYKQRATLQIDQFAPAEFLLAEGTGLADDQVNLPARCHINHVE